MPASVEQLHPQAAAKFLEMLESKPRQMYRVIYFSVVRDQHDINQVYVVKCVVHLFAEDATDAFGLFSNNVPEDYPANLVVSVSPVQPDIPEDSMLDIKRGPRGIADIEH